MRRLLQPERHRQLVELLVERGWDWLLVYGDGFRQDFVRFVYDLDFIGPYAAVAISASEVVAVVSDPWDEERARGLSGDDVRVELAGDAATALARWSDGRIAVAGLEVMETRCARALAERSGRTPVSATADIERLRLVKTEDEIAALRRAAALADVGFRHFVDVLEVGMAEYELVAEVEWAQKSRRAEDNFMLLSSGGTEVRSMKPSTDRRFVEGDLVATELTPQVDGFYAQICRSVVVGEPSDAQLAAFEIFRRAQQAAEDMLRPGVNISEIARAENDVFRDAGFGEYTGPQYTRVRGHGLGRFVDEKPQILEDVNCIVEEGMVLIAHPNTYLPTVGYMVFGDALVVTADGCERLATTDKKLFHTAV